MRIRGSANLYSSPDAAAASSSYSSSSSSSTSPSQSPSSSSSSPSSYSSCFSSTQSTIFTHSLTASSNSTSLSSISNSPTLLPARCEGLDLLVKAVYYVAGSVVGVPYIQRRVIRRRKRAIRFSHLVVKGFLEAGDRGGCEIKENSPEENDKNQRKKRQRKTASKYHDRDSVVPEQWKPPRSRKRRQSIGTEIGSGL